MPPLDPNHISPTGIPIAPAISREARQDGAAYIAALRCGLSAEAADALVAGMQARRIAVAALNQPAGTRMAARAEKHAADVAQMRAAEQARVAEIQHGPTLTRNRP